MVNWKCNQKSCQRFFFIFIFLNKSRTKSSLAVILRRFRHNCKTPCLFVVQEIKQSSPPQPYPLNRYWFLSSFYNIFQLSDRQERVCSINGNLKTSTTAFWSAAERACSPSSSLLFPFCCCWWTDKCYIWLLDTPAS